jgi:hypothetical protein
MPSAVAVTLSKMAANIRFFSSVVMSAQWSTSVLNIDCCWVNSGAG